MRNYASHVEKWLEKKEKTDVLNTTRTTIKKQNNIKYTIYNFESFVLNRFFDNLPLQIQFSFHSFSVIRITN